MFQIKNSELVIGGTVWVFNLDPLVISIKELVDPKPYTYKGRFTYNMEEYLLVEDENLLEEKIFVNFYQSETATGNYIVSDKRSTIINKLRILSTKENMVDITYIQIAKEYLKYLETNKPEWII